jgi:hypothetical protein
MEILKYGADVEPSRPLETLMRGTGTLSHSNAETAAAASFYVFAFLPSAPGTSGNFVSASAE